MIFRRYNAFGNSLFKSLYKFIYKIFLTILAKKEKAMLRYLYPTCELRTCDSNKFMKLAQLKEDNLNSADKKE